MIWATVALGLLASAAAREIRHADVFPKMLQAARKAAGIAEPEPLPAHFFKEQLLDHFDPLNTAVFSNRYFVNDEFYSPGGPVFLYINGEAPLNQAAINTGCGTTCNLAEKHNGLLVSLENRFFGVSDPLEDLSTENLRFHTVPQFLADLAYFQEWFTATSMYGLKDAKWVSIGGSYSGATTAWYRIKYPHLVHASYSSSGVVNPILDLPQYAQVIEHDILEVPGCHAAWTDAIAPIYKMLASEEGAAQLVKDFNICEDAAYVMANQTAFFFDIENPMIGAAQYGGQVKFCADLMNSSMGTPYQNLARMDNPPPSLPADCNSIDWIAQLQDTSNDNDGRSWQWMKCTTFGFFKTQDGDWLPKLPLDYLEGSCAQIFGPDVTAPDVAWTYEEYGGQYPVGSRIVFVEGTNDPYGPCDARPANSTAIPEQPHLLVQDGSHCFDMMPAAPGDSASVKEVRAQIYDYMATWLSQPLDWPPFQPH